MGNNIVEILYVAGRSAHRKGKRVLIREGGCENVLWPGEKLQDVDVALLGITERQRRQIAQFLSGGVSSG